jgi:hypothetical protein
MTSFTTRPRRARIIALLSFAGALLLGATGASALPQRVQLPNGIDALVYGPDDVLREATERVGDHLYLTAGSGLRYELVTEIDDPMIANRGDGRFHPMAVQDVADALAALHLDGHSLPVRIYILPFPRRQILDSSARDGAIFLSPGVRPVSDLATHFTVAHEIGHLYQYRWMPDSDTHAWQQYRQMRGISDLQVYHAAAAHADRPHEIFAEDFRYLFGGEQANYSGGIENESLPLPDAVSGLASFLGDLARVATPPLVTLRCAPNPFNPSTIIRVEFTADAAPEPASVRIVDVQGRAVRGLFQGLPAALPLQLVWDGRDTGGTPVASGVYFTCVEYQGRVFSTKLLLTK